MAKESLRAEAGTRCSNAVATRLGSSRGPARHCRASRALCGPKRLHCSATSERGLPAATKPQASLCSLSRQSGRLRQLRVPQSGMNDSETPRLAPRLRQMRLRLRVGARHARIVRDKTLIAANAERLSSVTTASCAGRLPRRGANELVHGTRGKTNLLSRRIGEVNSRAGQATRELR